MHEIIRRSHKASIFVHMEDGLQQLPGPGLSNSVPAFDTAQSAIEVEQLIRAVIEAAFLVAGRRTTGNPFTHP